MTFAIQHTCCILLFMFELFCFWIWSRNTTSNDIHGRRGCQTDYKRWVLEAKSASLANIAGRHCIKFIPSENSYLLSESLKYYYDQFNNRKTWEFNQNKDANYIASRQSRSCECTCEAISQNSFRTILIVYLTIHW